MALPAYTTSSEALLLDTLQPEFGYCSKLTPLFLGRFWIFFVSWFVSTGFGYLQVLLQQHVMVL